MKMICVFIISCTVSLMLLASVNTSEIKKARAVVESERCGVLLGLSNSVWGLPGGAIEKGESSEQAALREVREETGMEGNAILEVSLLGVNKALRSDIYLVRVADKACEHVTHSNDPDKEFAELKWFLPTALPENIYPDVVEHIDWFLRRSESVMKGRHAFSQGDHDL